jgi:hypothetical protein
MRAPVMAWVVETGRPVKVAMMTQPNAPMRMEMKKAEVRGVPLANRPVEKLLSSPPENQKEMAAPAAVVMAA